MGAYKKNPAGAGESLVIFYFVSMYRMRRQFYLTITFRVPCHVPGWGWDGCHGWPLIALDLEKHNGR